MQKNNAFCSICTVNYTAYAAVLNDSLKKVGHNEPHYVLIVDFDEKYRKIVEGFGFQAVPLESLAIPNVEELIRKYSAFELSNVLKPFFMEWLLKNHPEIDILIYLDTDIYVYSKFDNILEEMRNDDDFNIALTPHITSLEAYNKISGYSIDQLFLTYGLYNGGFYALKNNSKAWLFLDWHKRKMFDYGYAEADKHMFVDQKILDLSPIIFSGIKIYKNTAYNVAYWNYHERPLSIINDEYFVFENKLVFFHFSQLFIDKNDLEASLLFNISINNKPALKKIVLEYYACLIKNNHKEINKIVYGYADRYKKDRKFNQGTPNLEISLLQESLTEKLELIDSLKNEISMIKSSKTWQFKEKLSKWYHRINNLFFLKRRFEKIKYLSNSFKHSLLQEGAWAAVGRSFNLIFFGKGFLKNVPNKSNRGTYDDLSKIINNYNNNRLTITVFIPFDFSSKNFGGSLRIISVYTGLSKYFNVNLVGFRGLGDNVVVEKISDSLTTYFVSMSRPFFDLLKKEESLSGGYLHDILLSENYFLLPDLCQICSLLYQNTDIFVTSQPYFIKMLKDLCPQKTIIYESQNVEYDLKKTYFPGYENNEHAMRYLNLVDKIDELACQESDFILTVSEEDKNNLSNRYSFDRNKIIMLPNGIDATIYSDNKRSVKNKDIIFVGSLHQPNIEAVEFIINDLAPKNYEINYLIIGNVGDFFKNNVLPKNVKLLGVVSEEEKNRLYRESLLAINPMFSGSGTNTKLIEYAAAGIPILSTEFGLRGLDAFKKVVFIAEKDRFLDQIKAILSKDLVELNNISELSKKICLNNFDSSVIIRGLVSRIESIKKDIENKRNTQFTLAVEGRVLHRSLTGTERYITELVKSLSSSEKLKFFLVNNSDFNLQKEKRFIPKFSSLDIPNQKINLYHRTYQFGSLAEVNESFFAERTIFTFLDLILYKNPGYFANKSEHEKYSQCMSVAVNSADRLIAISNHAKNDLIKEFGISSDKIDVTYLGVDHGKFKEITDAETIRLFKKKHNLPEKYILCLGTNYPHKNLKNLLIAFKYLIDNPSFQDVKLVIAGNHNYSSNNLEEYFSPIKNNILNLGHFSDDEIGLLYSSAEIFVFPSLYEGFGLPVLEAFASGVPVVCSNATSLPEVAGDAAILVDASKPLEITKAMINILQDDNLRKKLVAKGVNRSKEFTWEKCAQETIGIYHKTLKQPIINKNI